MGPRAGLDGCGKSRPQPGFDPRAVQPVASRYTDYTTRPQKKFCHSADLFRGWRILCKLYSEFWLDSHYRFILSKIPAHRTPSSRLCCILVARVKLLLMHARRTYIFELLFTTVSV